MATDAAVDTAESAANSPSLPVAAPAGQPGAAKTPTRDDKASPTSNGHNGGHPPVTIKIKLTPPKIVATDDRLTSPPDVPSSTQPPCYLPAFAAEPFEYVVLRPLYNQPATGSDKEDEKEEVKSEEGKDEGEEESRRKKHKKKKKKKKKKHKERGDNVEEVESEEKEEEDEEEVVIDPSMRMGGRPPGERYMPKIFSPTTSPVKKTSTQAAEEHPTETKNTKTRSSEDIYGNGKMKGGPLAAVLKRKIEGKDVRVPVPQRKSNRTRRSTKTTKPPETSPLTRPAFREDMPRGEHGMTILRPYQMEYIQDAGRYLRKPGASLLTRIITECDHEGSFEKWIQASEAEDSKRQKFDRQEGNLRRITFNYVGVMRDTAKEMEEEEEDLEEEEEQAAAPPTIMTSSGRVVKRSQPLLQSPPLPPPKKRKLPPPAMKAAKKLTPAMQEKLAKEAEVAERIRAVLAKYQEHGGIRGKQDKEGGAVEQEGGGAMEQEGGERNEQEGGRDAGTTGDNVDHNKTPATSEEQTDTCPATTSSVMLSPPRSRDSANFVFRSTDLDRMLADMAESPVFEAVEPAPKEGPKEPKTEPPNRPESPPLALVPPLRPLPSVVPGPNDYSSIRGQGGRGGGVTMAQLQAARSITLAGQGYDTTSGPPQSHEATPRPPHRSVPVPHPPARPPVQAQPLPADPPTRLAAAYPPPSSSQHRPALPLPPSPPPLMSQHQVRGAPSPPLRSQPVVRAPSYSPPLQHVLTQPRGFRHLSNNAQAMMHARARTSAQSPAQPLPQHPPRPSPSSINVSHLRVAMPTSRASDITTSRLVVEEEHGYSGVAAEEIVTTGQAEPSSLARNRPVHHWLDPMVMADSPSTSSAPQQPQRVMQEPQRIMQPYATAFSGGSTNLNGNSEHKKLPPLQATVRHLPQPANRNNNGNHSPTLPMPPQRFPVSIRRRTMTQPLRVRTPRAAVAASSSYLPTMVPMSRPQLPNLSSSLIRRGAVTGSLKRGFPILNGASSSSASQSMVGSSNDERRMDEGNGVVAAVNTCPARNRPATTTPARDRVAAARMSAPLNALPPFMPRQFPPSQAATQMPAQTSRTEEDDDDILILHEIPGKPLS